VSRRYKRTKAQKQQLADCPSPEVAEELLDLFQAQHRERTARAARVRASQAHQRSSNDVRRCNERVAEKLRSWAVKQGLPDMSPPPIDAIPF
jgi:hypothetical protein